MDNPTHAAVRSLISAREEAAFHHLSRRPDYQEICRRQEESEAAVQELYRRFDPAERTAVRRHYEGEVHKACYELEAAYRQGLRDGFSLLSYLGGNEVSL